MPDTIQVTLTLAQAEFLFQILNRAQITGADAENIVVLKSILQVSAQAARKPETTTNDTEPKEAE